jgi:hypothetical protein
MLNVNYAIDGRVELRDLHKLLQERVLGTIHVGSEANITGVIKKPLASIVDDMRRGLRKRDWEEFNDPAKKEAYGDA